MNVTEKTKRVIALLSHVTLMPNEGDARRYHAMFKELMSSLTIEDRMSAVVEIRELLSSVGLGEPNQEEKPKQRVVMDIDFFEFFMNPSLITKVSRMSENIDKSKSHNKSTPQHISKLKEKAEEYLLTLDPRNVSINAPIRVIPYYKVVSVYYACKDDNTTVESREVRKWFSDRMKELGWHDIWFKNQGCVLYVNIDFVN